MLIFRMGRRKDIETAYANATDAKRSEAWIELERRVALRKESISATLQLAGMVFLAQSFILPFAWGNDSEVIRHAARLMSYGFIALLLLTAVSWANLIPRWRGPEYRGLLKGNKIGAFTEALSSSNKQRAFLYTLRVGLAINAFCIAYAVWQIGSTM